MALLTAVVRKEALLPELTAAFAATQLLPVIMEATHWLITTARPSDSAHLCKELVVSARADSC